MRAFQNLSNRQYRIFGAGLTAILTAAVLFRFWKDGRWNLYLIMAAVLVLLPVLIYPKALKPLYVVLSKFGLVVNFILTHAVMFFVYYVIITPFSLIKRIRGNHFLQIEIDSSASSYWEDVSQSGNDPESIKHQF